MNKTCLSGVLAAALFTAVPAIAASDIDPAGASGPGDWTKPTEITEAVSCDPMVADTCAGHAAAGPVLPAPDMPLSKITDENRDG